MTVVLNEIYSALLKLDYEFSINLETFKVQCDLNSMLTFFSSDLNLITIFNFHLIYMDR